MRKRPLDGPDGAGAAKVPRTRKSKGGAADANAEEAKPKATQSAFLLLSTCAKMESRRLAHSCSSYPGPAFIRDVGSLISLSIQNHLGDQAATWT